MLVAGEAANTVEFLDVVHGVVRAIPGPCESESRAEEWKENGKAGQVQFDTGWRDEQGR